MTDKKITITSSFGVIREVTREEFIRRWTDHVAQVEGIALIPADHQAIGYFLAYVTDLAGRQFDEMWERENP